MREAFFKHIKSSAVAKLVGNSILENFSGKISNVVVAQWNGITYIRSLPTQSKKRKPSEKQLHNRLRFQIANQVVTIFRSLFKLSIEEVKGQSASSSAMSKLLQDAITPGLDIDFSRLMVSRGTLPPATGAKVESIEPGVLKFQWTDEVSVNNKKKDYDKNQVLLVAYIQNEGQLFYDLHGVKRSTLSGELKIEGHSGKKLHTWICFRSDDFKLKSDSVYVGQVELK
jgi:hypothetical protein